MLVCCVVDKENLSEPFDGLLISMADDSAILDFYKPVMVQLLHGETELEQEDGDEIGDITYTSNTINTSNRMRIMGHMLSSYCSYKLGYGFNMSKENNTKTKILQR